MDGGDERAESPSGGNGGERTDLQLNASIEQLLSTSAVTIAEVDSILRDGGNSQDSNLRIAAFFAKSKDSVANAEFLKREYLERNHREPKASGKGFDFGNHNVCAWFEDDGISLAIGTTAKNNIHRVTIPWETAAERIGELYDAGQFVTQDGFAEALDNERHELAGRLWNFYRDDMSFMPEEWDAVRGGYPETEAFIKDALDDDTERQAILDRLETDAADFINSGAKRSWHNPSQLLSDMRDTMIAPRNVPAAVFTSKPFKYFITQDEIDALLLHGGNYSEGKYRILSHFLNNNGDKERIDFLKEAYGNGGGSWSDTDGWHDAAPSKGLSLSRGRIGSPDAEVNMGWGAVARRVDALVKSGQYMSQAELDGIASYEKIMLARSINAFYYDLPDEYPRPFAKGLDFHYPHDEWNALNDFLSDDERVGATVDQMRYIFENTPDNDRHYNSRKSGLERLAAFQEGVYTLFPGIENLPAPGTPTAVRYNERVADMPAEQRREIIMDIGDRIAPAWGEVQVSAEQLSIFDAMRPLPSVEEQRDKIDQSLRHEAAEIEAASVTLENDTDAVLLNISNEDKARLYEQFADNPRSRAAVNLVKEIYGDTLPFPMPQAMKRITELAAEGKFTAIEANSELHMTAVGDFYELYGDEAQTVADMLGLTLITSNGEPMVGFPKNVADDYGERLGKLGYTLVRPEAESQEQPATRAYAVGDVLWLDEHKFVIDEIGDYYTQPDDLARKFGTYGYSVKLTDITGGYPLMRSMYSAEVDYKLDMDERNAAFAPIGEPQATPETVAEVTPEPEPVPPPDFDAVAQTVYGRVMADENFAYHLQFAQSRGALRSPLNAALDKIVGELQAEEPVVYADYFNDDITDGLFDHVYKTAWENRPQQAQPEAAQEPGDPLFTEVTDPAVLAEVAEVFPEPVAAKFTAERFYREPDTDYYLIRTHDGADYPPTFSRDELKLITNPAKNYVICAEACYIAEEDMARYHITFRKMPRDFGLLPSEAQARVAEIAPQYREHWQANQELRSTPVMQQLLRYEIRPIALAVAESYPPNGDSLGSNERYGIWDTQMPNQDGGLGDFLMYDDDRHILFNTEEEAAAYIDSLNRVALDSLDIDNLPAQTPQTQTVTRTPAANFRITDDHLGEGGAKAKFRGNIDAIRTLQTIEEERRSATPDEQEILSRYVGWGGLPQAFDPDNSDWAQNCVQLQELLTPEEYDSARASTLNAHFTPPVVIKAMWEAVERMGFKSGNILEPSCGIGNFMGLIPQDLWQSKLYGVELDGITARIANQLYPKANIQQTGFEKTEFSDAFFDLAIGNVPFGQYGVADNRYDKHHFSIHDYFFAKTLDKVRPGGVVAFITSKFTMDSKNPEVRKYLAQRAELLGAVRLPNNAFLKNAGTETTMDILFLQKRDRPLDIEPDWVHLGLTEDGIPVNRYYIDNPEMLCGTMALDERMNNKYGRDDYTACLPVEGADLGEQLKTALLNVQGTYEVTELDDLDGVDNHAIPADYSVKNFSYALVEGTVYFRENSLMYPVDLPTMTLERIKGMVGLRDCVQELIRLQLDEYPESAIKAQQAELNALYDGFIAEFGLINSQANNRAFNADSAYYLLSSLEIINEDGELDRKADMFTKRTIKQKVTVDHVDTASEALAVSLGERAGVDMAYMSDLSGKDEQTLFEELRGVIFITTSGGYETADEFLSGNVREKLRLYKLFADDTEISGSLRQAYRDNVDALTAAQPKDLEAGDIAVRLGATWIDPEYVQQFMYELLGTTRFNRDIYKVKYHQYTGEWQIIGKGKAQFSDIASTVTYGTGRMNAYQIIDDTLNLRDVRVYDYKEDADGKERRVLNKKETMLAQQKQEIIKQKFKDWLWNDPDRRQTLTAKYNELFNSMRPREYDGSHITFGGISPEIELKPHQLNAIAHILYGGNTLLAHVVGAGKTFEMTAAAMEAKRLGLCQKSLFAVPNHLTEQWAGEFLRLYPSANILVATKKDFEMRNRKKFCAKIATGDYDAVIIGHSQLEKIPMSRERQERLLNEQLWEVEQGIRELKESNGEKFSIKGLEKTKKSLEARLTKLLESKKRDDVVTFEQLGVDRLFVDEAHGFKNLFLYTKMRNVAGLSNSEAAKSSDLFMKCRYMDELTGGKGTIFATGTPISNSMTEMYTMQRYLQYDTLQSKNLTHFDSWASIFGETQTSIELAPEGTGYRARTRFAKFHNLPELMSLFKDVADIQTADMLNLPVPEAKFETVVVEPSELQKEMVQELSERAAAVHNREVDATVDNMLKITTDGRKIGLDQRLINPLLEDFPGSKVNACTENVFQIWNDTRANRLTQLVFCDFSTPNKEGRFNVYDDIKEKLIERGIPEHEIAFIHDADTETRKKELFAKVRQGKVRVLFGSTFKMGSGTNVQDKLIAIHDADCPWRLADLEQRAGRIIRQGNQNEEVKIFRYATSGTFDSYLWQTVESKQKFIAQIMSSKSPVRSCEDVDETALSYAEIKALCAGNPLIAEKMNLDNEVSRMRLLRSEYRSQHYRLEDSLLKQFPQQIASVTERIACIEKDIAHYAAEKDKCSEVVTLNGAASASQKFPGMTINGVTHVEKEPAGKALLECCKGVTDKSDKPIGEYMGFKMSVAFDSFSKQFRLLLRGNLTYQLDLGTDAFGNITRINHALDDLPKRLEGQQSQLDNLHKQQESAKAELAQPFPYEAELAAKEERLNWLNSDLNIDGDGGMDIINDTESRDAGSNDGSEQEQPQGSQKDNYEYESRDDADEPPLRTGTYGKAAPSFLDNIRKFDARKQDSPPASGRTSSHEL
ncbi:hypothetical protein FACS1894202_01510 [Clostridia bacterium]|nr:hypothetical protein FACS1894202_01510 [Clostridia bacterium]